jgi:CO/xanthine dehydrogenase Mo-binding subunit
VGVDKKGKLQAEEILITADSGAYCATSPFVIWRPTVQCTGPYIVPNVKCDTRAVYTNNTFTGAMRGFGSPQVNFAIESMTDIVAHEIGMDPVEFPALHLGTFLLEEDSCRPPKTRTVGG